MIDRLDNDTQPVPLALPLRIATDQGSGTAIAMAFADNEMIYLVAMDHAKSAPEWTSEREITSSSVELS